MYYELLFREDLSEQDAALVRAYWAIENGQFTHKVDELAARHGITRVQLTSLAAGATTCRVSLGHCLGCGDEVLRTLPNKTAFVQCAENVAEPRCPDCQRAYEKRQRYEVSLLHNQAVSALDQNAVRLKSWEFLTPDELSVLKGIVRYKTKSLIYEHVFKGDKGNRAIWKLVNQLTRRGLVEVVRSYQDYIEEFTFQPELEAHLFAASDALPAAPATHFHLKLLKNKAKEKPWQPDYAGVVTLQEAVLLPKGTRLAYGAWNTNAKDLLVQFRPFEAVRHYNRPERSSSDPVSIEQIIERYFDAFTDPFPTKTSGN